jgi:hypothetical protein
MKARESGSQKTTTFRWPCGEIRLQRACNNDKISENGVAAAERSQKNKIFLKPVAIVRGIYSRRTKPQVKRRMNYASYDIRIFE